MSSESCSTHDVTSARWYEAFETHAAVAQSTSWKSQPVGLSGQAPQKQSLDRKDPDVRVVARRTKEKLVALLVPNVEAWHVAVSHAT